MKSYKKSKKKLLKKISNKKSRRKASKKKKTFKNKKKLKKQNGGYNRDNCMVSLKEIFINNNSGKNNVYSTDVMKQYTDTIFKLRNKGNKDTYGNTPYTKQLIDYFYDCIGKDFGSEDRVNVHEGLYIEL